MKKKFIPAVVTCLALCCIVAVIALCYNKPASEVAHTGTEQENVITPSDKELTEAEKDELYNEEMEKKIKDIVSDIEGITSVTVERNDTTIIVNVHVASTFDATMKEDIAHLAEVVYPDFQIEINLLEESV